MDKKDAAALRQAFDAMVSRTEALEARLMAANLMLEAVIRCLPDQQALVTAAQHIADTPPLAHPTNPVQREAVRLLRHRLHLSEPET
jgi:hypothetical protein